MNLHRFIFSFLYISTVLVNFNLKTKKSTSNIILMSSLTLLNVHYILRAKRFMLKQTGEPMNEQTFLDF